jgi:hypothetical protein
MDVESDEPSTQQEEDEKEQTTLELCVTQWGVVELDEFYKCVDFMEPHEQVDSLSSHWIYNTPLTMVKQRGREEATPMYAIGTRHYSAQRISLILDDQRDPCSMRHINVMCGQPNCINPTHLNVLNRNKTQQ